MHLRRLPEGILQGKRSGFICQAMTPTCMRGIPGATCYCEGCAVKNCRHVALAAVTRVKHALAKRLSVQKGKRSRMTAPCDGFGRTTRIPLQLRLLQCHQDTPSVACSSRAYSSIGTGCPFKPTSVHVVYKAGSESSKVLMNRGKSVRLFST